MDSSVWVYPRPRIVSTDGPWWLFDTRAPHPEGSLVATTQRTAWLFVAALVGSLVVTSPAVGLNYFGLVDTGELFVSANNGVTWTGLSTLPVLDAVGLIAGASSSDLYLISQSGSVYRSTDAGGSWAAIAAVSASDVTALVPYPGRLLLLTRTGGVYASLDGGASFSGVGTITTSDLVAGARSGTSVVALSKSGGVYRSADAGVTWSAVGAIAVSNARAIVGYLNRLYVLTETGDLARSEDLGASWTFVSTLSQSGMTALLATPGELVATTAAGEVAASSDGLSWTWRGVINQLTVRALASDQPFPTAGGQPELSGVGFRAVWPNPVHGAATLAFDLDRRVAVTVSVHDLAGREVARPIADEFLGPGIVLRPWEARDLPSGVYFLAARIGAQERVRRITVMSGK